MNALEFRFALFARDFDDSVHFYRNILGLEPVGQGWDRPDGKGALLSAGGNGVIEIYGAANGKTYEGPGPLGMNLALRLENASAVDEFYQRLSAGGIGRLDPPENRDWGHYSFVVYDPDHIPVHIYCELTDQKEKKVK
jgi:catechol 2,3-dioxygenase-like lactoylglutathione lyase family enzyme